MSFRSGKSFKRYFFILTIIILIIYFSSLQVRNIDTKGNAFIIDDEDHIDHADLPLDYIPPTRQNNPDINDFHLEMTQTHSYLIELARKRIDRKYCGQERCKFLLPIAITEQESKAQYHFRQLAFLSGKLKRTIVLPNVDSSHLGACRKQPFSFYYDDTWLNQHQQYFNYITMDQFKRWIEERHAIRSIPTGQEVFIEIDKNFPHLSKAVNCFKDKFDFTHRPRSRLAVDDPETTSKRIGNFTNIFLNLLSDKKRLEEYLSVRYQQKNEKDDDDDMDPILKKNQQELDVIHLYYDRRFGYIEEPEVEIPLNYHPRWEKIADDISQQLEPFVAVHWRMERLEPLSHLKPCAEELVRKLNNIQTKEQGKELNVFLLTDYPHLLQSRMAKPESMSFKLSELHEEHHEAIQYLYHHVNVTLTTLQQPVIPYQDLPSENWNLIPVHPLARPPDKSILGIVDKLVAIRAQWFLYGEASICGKDSSFTRRIRLERQNRFKLGDQHIISPVDVFKLP